ncbi:MAG: pantetheine-phosphate adenylyltransferase [Clostridia bacterium]|nr:pantetheine-phosphate adenylyltransferase [Clostridia bacterium]
MSLAIVPGSFDPITVGHVDVIERTAKLFDTVVVAVIMNASKEYRFTIEQRAQLAKISCAHIPNVKVLVSEGMLVDVVRELGATAIVKGVRTAKDFAYEQKMAHYNRALNPKAETLYLPCSPELKRISSTLVRKRMDENRSLEGILMPEAIRKLKEGFDPK